MGIEHAIIIFLLAFGSGYMTARDGCKKIKCIQQEGGIQKCFGVDADVKDFSVECLHGLSGCGDSEGGRNKF